MRKFKGHVEMGLVGCKREFEFEVEDDATEDEIEETGRDAMFNIISWGYEEVNK